MSKLETVKQLWQFLMQRKKYWLVPIVVVFVLLGLLVILGEGSVLAPMIYSLF